MNQTHGMTGTPTFRTWQMMRQRCGNPRDDHYKNYGARGIRVCERWDSFENFLSDMGTRPIGATLDRIDNDGNYEPSNCRWADLKTQHRNTRRNHFVEAFGHRLTTAEWSERQRIPYGTLKQRLRNGWPVERALTEPVHAYSRSV